MLLELCDDVVADIGGILVAFLGETPVLAENGRDLTPGLGRSHGVFVFVGREIVLAAQGLLAGNAVEEVQQLDRLRGRIGGNGPNGGFGAGKQRNTEA